ncbi:ABC transporter permease [Roseovarius sp. PS-C2]|uniref:ABC transporter permease n=1 Tax=Roseovarius sp. PS-C2 TaxID=2820814 RepID=UPI00346046E6
MKALSDTIGHIAPPRPRPQRRFASARAIFALILREMSTTYGRSPGGYVWEVLQPVGGIALLSIVFSYAFRSPPIGTSFALFYATGFIVLSHFNGLNQKMGIAIRFSKPLLTYPNVTLMDAILARFLLNTLTSFLVFIILMTGIVTMFDLRIILDLPEIFKAWAMLTALSFGVGILNCFLMSMFPVWQQVWQILTRPLFIVSGIFFLIDNLPAAYRDILLYNPVAHVIMQMRAGFYATYEAPLVSPVYVYLISLVCAVSGVLLLHRYHRMIIDER